MQESLIELLKDNGMDVQKVKSEKWEDLENEIYRIIDSDRLIFLVELRDIEGIDLKSYLHSYVDGLMEWITYEHPTIGEDLVDKYQHITMRKILWDMYVIFVNRLKENVKGLSDEEIYPIHRNSHFMKRFIVQGISDDEIANQISFIVRPERIIDEFINKLDYKTDEERNCRQMCQTKEQEEFDYDLKGKTYQEIITILEKINGEAFGVDANENT